MAPRVLAAALRQLRQVHAQPGHGATYAFPPPAVTALAVDGTRDLFPVRRVFCVGRNYAAVRRRSVGELRRAARLSARSRLRCGACCADATPRPCSTRARWAATPPASLLSSSASRPTPSCPQRTQAARCCSPSPPPPPTCTSRSSRRVAEARVRRRQLLTRARQVVALGRGGTDIDAKDALACVFGYGIGVDFTRRDMQARRAPCRSAARGADGAALQDEAKRTKRPWDMSKVRQSAPTRKRAQLAGADARRGAGLRQLGAGVRAGAGTLWLAIC